MTERFFQHERAIVETANIGEGTRVWAFAHILPGACVGRDCNICDHTFIENDVLIGDRVTIKCGVQIWDGLRIEDDVFVGPNATFTNDLFPRSKHYVAPEKRLQTVVKRGASIGANATILPGVVIGERAMIGAGAVVTRNVPPDAIVTGNPGKVVGYVGLPRPVERAVSVSADSSATEVRGVLLHSLPRFSDMRGALTFGEGARHVPFEIKRFFLVYDVPSREVRGEHAHKTLHQFLICVQGSCCVVADDGRNRREFHLDSPSQGLYLPPMTWSVQYKHSPDAIILVLASAPYDASDYIREYEEFLRLLDKTSAPAQ
jgi:acetyltransferase-like isoleucine patch superfamily enzyme/dTDP-4-dehydrorhamnose 3,5-epimerase-like enzyme